MPSVTSGWLSHASGTFIREAACLEATAGNLVGSVSANRVPHRRKLSRYCALVKVDALSEQSPQQALVATCLSEVRSIRNGPRESKRHSEKWAGTLGGSLFLSPHSISVNWLVNGHKLSTTTHCPTKSSLLHPIEILRILEFSMGEKYNSWNQEFFLKSQANRVSLTSLLNTLYVVYLWQLYFSFSSRHRVLLEEASCPKDCLHPCK